MRRIGQMQQQRLTRLRRIAKDLGREDSFTLEILAAIAENAEADRQMLRGAVKGGGIQISENQS